MLQRNALAPMVFLFVIDLCQEDDDLQALKVSYIAGRIIIAF